MLHSRRRLAVLGLYFAALSLMAVTATDAHAEKGANWVVNGFNVTSILEPDFRIAQIENATGSFLTKIGGAKVTILCTAANLFPAKLEPEGHLLRGSWVEFTGCVTLLNGVLSKVCAPSSPGTSSGSIRSSALSGLLVLHEGSGIVKFEPFAGTNLAELRFNGFEGCALPETVPVRGVFFVKDCKNEMKKELITHLVEQGPLTHLYVISDTAEHAASIDGSATVELLLSHFNLKWAGFPG